ncbi:ets DNA-binding protein pokkuri [Culex quinquefasciatus]|uniref:Ets DNA-binding protein pokkuri n=1 Tax=Culex quinquefasciatus TaxID=7176 RepID=B0X600_CULQU|nr:ets DNA-binding protein pokkuri [Culex quinquefasciatus]|eukprot:XP_001865072.1 ets DNA-binding protein pokkuri [Culex quinquefasciatus]
MKLLPIPLSPLNPPAPLGIWGSDLLWRYPPAPPSPLADLKTQLPPQLNTDPRIWGREEVAVFLRFCEREFDLPKFDLDLFQMNGKALCVLTKNDLAERSPGAGDVLHNVLQMLVRDAQSLHRHLPSSPVTPTSRYPLSPHSHPPTPNWSALAPPDSPFFHNSHLQQFMAASNSVTLSPAPSIDSQAGSPPQSHQEQLQNVFQKSSSSSSSHTQNSTSGGSSNQSDSDEDNSTAGYHHPLPLSHPDSKLPLLNPSNQSPPLTPISKETQHLGQLQLLDTKTLQYPVSALLNNSSNANAISSSPSAGDRSSNGNSSNGSSTHSLNLKSPTLSPPSSASPNGSSSTPTTPGAFLPVKREFFPDGPEPNTNGRLLWDFLQQLLNDPAQRYSSYIAWKCRDTGVFKIVDPAGLAKLWGKQKNHLSMNYDKMSRALRYYYRVNILRKVQGERHCYQFLRNPTELKSIKNISLLRQTMASQNANGQSAAAAAAAASAASQHSLMSLLPNGANIHHLAAAAVAAAASHQQQQQQQQQANGPLSPSALHHPHVTSSASVPTSNGQSTNGATHHPTIKMETDIDELKPTDLSTSDRKYYGTGSNGVDCYPLIRNANGLTTIQLLRQQQQQQQSQQAHDAGSPPTSPSPLSLNSQSLHTISNNLHHLHQQQMQAQAAAAAAAVAAAEARHREDQEEQRRHEHLAAEHHDREHHERNDRSPSPTNDHHHQHQPQPQQQQQHRGSDDESMMPTDLSKSDSMYYK